MASLRTQFLLSLTYKILDHFPEQMTLFGGIVRDFVAPAYWKGVSPFQEDFPIDNEIADIDLLFTPENPEEDSQSIHPFVFSKLQQKIREWDWKIGDVSELSTYGPTGYRVQIDHKIVKHISTHLDIVLYKEAIFKDFDVNILYFNKKKGLFTRSDTLPIQSLGEHFGKNTFLKKILRRISKKECRMILGTHTQNSLYRVKKMITKGWKIIGLNHRIRIHEEKKENDETICSICQETPKEPHRWVELTCSKCFLCQDCFFQLLERQLQRESGFPFTCPTCREKIMPW